MIQIKTKKGMTHFMTIPEFSKWACLVEAFHFIEQRANEMNIDFTNLIKPNAIEKYIDERYHAMMHDVKIEYELGNI